MKKEDVTPFLHQSVTVKLEGQTKHGRASRIVDENGLELVTTIRNGEVTQTKPVVIPLDTIQSIVPLGK